MRYELRKEEDFAVSKWMGGKTKELAIFPPESKYIDRDFIWRLSSATVELEESDFSKLPDYDRVLMVMEGSAVLTYDGKRSIRLKELEQDSFDGGAKTKSFGKITDFNVMVRKGCNGILDVIRPDSEAKVLGDTLHTERKCTTHALYVKEGFLVVNYNGTMMMVKQGEILIMEFFNEIPVYGVMGEGVVIRAQMGYDYDIPEGQEAAEAPEIAPEAAEQDTEGVESAAVTEESKTAPPVIDRKEEPKEPEGPVDKGSFWENFKWAFFIANTQFRGAKYIVRKLKTIWYDDKLYNVIYKMEKIMVTFIVLLLGVLVCLSMFAKKGLSEGAIVGILAVWVLIDCLIVSPLIYYFALPKPIASHVKNLDDVSEEELEGMIRKSTRDERTEKLLKKYKNTGRANRLNRENDSDLPRD
ncbi:MAG: HutD family protein [Firmicutes bacterium]|nr:HutD family protein [Bacillota bacterium]